MLFLIELFTPGLLCFMGYCDFFEKLNFEKLSCLVAGLLCLFE